MLTSDPVNVNTTEVSVTEERISPNVSVSCPRPEPVVNVTREYSHLQNPDMDTRVSMSDDVFKVHGVDAYGKGFGSSMAPSIMSGDIVISERFTDQSLEEGMIIRFKNGDGGFTIHRVTGVYTGQGFVLASGDTASGQEKVDLSRVTHVVKGVVYG